MTRPLIRHGERHANRGISPTKFRHTLPHAFQRRFRREPLAGRPRTRKKGLDLPQLLAQLRLGRHRQAPGLFLKTQHPATLRSTAWASISTPFSRLGIKRALSEKKTSEKCTLHHLAVQLSVH